MSKRFAKAGKKESQFCPADDGLFTTNFGEKYELHIQQMHHRLQEQQTDISKLEQIQRALEAEVDALMNERDEARHNLRAADTEKNSLTIEHLRIRRELRALNNELHGLKRAKTASDIAKVMEMSKAVEAVGSAETQCLKDELEAIEQGFERIAVLEKQQAEISASRTEVADRLLELEALSLTEVHNLKKELSDIKTNKQEMESRKELELNDWVEKVANITAAYNANMSEMEQVRAQQKEVKELLDLKAEIQDRESSRSAVIEGQGNRIEVLDQECRNEQTMQKRYFNQIQDLKGKIRVYCRIRPMLQSEVRGGQQISVSVLDDMTIGHRWRGEKKDREYVFDSVFAPDVKQEVVFEDTKHLIQSAIDGFNVCIFAYGQTGSGKTFTIYGAANNPGLTPRGVSELFRIIERDTCKYTAVVKCYMLELYTDYLVDLLAPEKKKPVKLEIKKDAKGMVVVNGANLVEVTSAQHLMDTIEYGQKRRHVSCTNMNREPSRSHLITSFIIECTNSQTQSVSTGKLSFVDLAGSGRVDKSEALGDQMKEAQAINKSLSALGDVISSLATGTGHIPYRNHKLTMLLSDSLGGNAKTLMYVNVSPTDSNEDETRDSLVYSTRLRAVNRGPSEALIGREQARLKKLVDQWKCGKASYAEEALID